MAEGRQRSEWNHTAQVLAMIYNAHRNPKARLMKPAEFHPFGSRKTAAPKIKDLSILKTVFVKE
ncbi:MAG: hypothetical protein KJZ87_15815 [Thermoguttaceae bacterium]|nr:hypothetical protein [Thermoguttaceae bacterium]